MIRMLAPANPLFASAAALAALLAVSSRDPLWLWECAHSTATSTGRRWLPWALLIALAAASGVFAMLHPQELAIASGQGIVPSGPLVAALSQP